MENIILQKLIRHPVRKKRFLVMITTVSSDNLFIISKSDE